MVCRSNLMKRRWMTRRSSVCISILIVLTDRVDNFKQINMELLTFKLSKVWSKWKVCTLSANFRWSQTTMTSELLQQGLESGQLSQPRQCNHHSKTNLIFVWSHTKAAQWVLIKGLKHFPQDLEVKNEFKTSQNPINIPFKIKKNG
jgi:hypothetical protein